LDYKNYALQNYFQKVAKKRLSQTLTALCDVMDNLAHSTKVNETEGLPDLVLSH
jgi:hypothetical protein